jgi:two-component sensor histidine kinase
LTHRVKNTLAIVQAMANQSLHRAKSPVEFVSGFSGRVQALARAHDLLTQTKLQGAPVLDIVRDQVLFGADDTRVACSGSIILLQLRNCGQKQSKWPRPKMFSPFCCAPWRLDLR